ncbi:calpain-9 [Paramormyrops kingsleyae]|uniref:calpain-9 n=1 Tax=Paramormyrops kingsleyae TaxID=1676925 RepID=UPI003B9703AE
MFKTKTKTPDKSSSPAGPLRQPLASSAALAPSVPSFSNTNYANDGLFVDTTFPYGNMQQQTNIVWKRPKDICQSPQFIVGGATCMDVCQGSLSDCWFLSVVTSLSLHRHLLERVVPCRQSFQEGYTGCFVFQFWQYGEWKEVKIDDFLPTCEGQLVYLRSSAKEEFWSSLLEKAYAKLKGGYQALNMGFPHEAMVDMTGGVTEVFSMAAMPHDSGHFLEGLLKRGALINCASTQGALEQKNKFGIMFRHAYSITAVEKVTTRTGVVELVRVYNPWGNTEWEGPWSDKNGSEWNQVSKAEQDRIGRTQAEDGEFWMTLSDFCLNFDEIEVCHLTEATLSGLDTVKPWQCTLHQGSWVPSLSAGGPPGGVRFWQNPQFHLTLQEEDEDPRDPELTCTFLVALMQKNKRRTETQLAINLHIYKVRSDQSYLSHLDLSLLKPLLCMDSYSPRREVVVRGHLPPGQYVIIPSTWEAGLEGEFILRVLTEKGNTTKPSQKPSKDVNAPMQMQTIAPTQSVLPSVADVQQIFNKHCCNMEQCRAADLYKILKEVISTGALAGSEKELCLEHCKSFVALMDSKGSGQLDWLQFQSLWDVFTKWTDIFVLFDKNKSQSLEYCEILPALTAAGLQVDEFLIQLIGLRYTEPDMTVNYPGFLSLLLKLNTMIQKFHSFDLMGMGAISLNYRQWLYLTMYN